MKNCTLAEINKAIPYIPVLRPYVGSIAACILMQQLDYWFSIKNGAPFYKFLVAQKGEKSHPAYKPGDSWCEELSISPDEFRSAFDKIGYRYKSFTEYKRAIKRGNQFQGYYYASYHDKIKGLTWYLRNHDLVDALLFEIFTRRLEKSIYVNNPIPSTYINEVHSRKSEKSIPNISEITPEIIPKNTTTKPVTNVVGSTATPEKETLSALFDLIPVTEHCQRLINAISEALEKHDKEYVRSNIEYCLLKHKPDEGKNSLGGMITSALFADYAETTRAKEAERAKAKSRNEEKRRKHEEQERLRIEAQTEEDRRWSESEHGKMFREMLLSG